MKAVMMSIQPEWCKLIADGKKTLEVRKSKPKLKTPFKAYIYCTKGGDKYGYQIFVKPKNANQAKGICTGTVFGEFVCNRIDHLVHSGTCRQDKQLTILNSDLSYSQFTNEYLRKTYLTLEEIEAYSKGGDVYAWQISDLVIYDKPKKIYDFVSFCPEYEKQNFTTKCHDCEWFVENRDALCYECACEGEKRVRRPPQSWCYVEDNG